MTIVDDEPLLSITATDANADEAGDAGAFTISRAGPITSSLSVNVTISGTATSGGDYSSITVPVVIAANSATAPFAHQHLERRPTPQVIPGVPVDRNITNTVSSPAIVPSRSG